MFKIFLIMALAMQAAPIEEPEDQGRPFLANDATTWTPYVEMQPPPSGLRSQDRAMAMKHIQAMQAWKIKRSAWADKQPTRELQLKAGSQPKNEAEAIKIEKYRQMHLIAVEKKRKQDLAAAKKVKSKAK